MNILPAGKTAEEGRAPTLATASDLARLVGGRWTREPQRPIQAIRQRLEYIEPGCRNFLFAPEMFTRQGDAMARSGLFMAPEAIERGAIGCLVRERPRNLSRDVACLIVDDVTEALKRFALYQRESSNAKFIAVTGSVGKSTTKNMIHSLLAMKGTAHKSIFNYNNYLNSTYFTLANLSPEHEFCVTEFGLGDLLDQPSLYKPHISVITCVEWEHVEAMERRGFKGEASIDRLVHLKTAFARNLGPGGIAIVNRDNQFFNKTCAEIRSNPNATILTFGEHEEADVRLVHYEQLDHQSLVKAEFRGRSIEYRLALPGRHMVQNSLAAIAAAEAAGAEIELCLDAFNQERPDTGRGQWHRLSWKGGEIVLLDETYHSNIPGLRACLALLTNTMPSAGGRRIAVLGTIGDLGSTLKAQVEDLARYASGLPIERYYTIGQEMRYFREVFSAKDRLAPHAQTLEQLERQLRNDLNPNDVVALKGNYLPAVTALSRLVSRLGEAVKPVPPVLAPEENQRNALRIVIGGDTYFGEYYQEKRERRAETNFLKSFGYDYSLQGLVPFLKTADCVVVNLECALTTQHASPLGDKKAFVLRGDPLQTIAALKRANVAGVMLANNHSMDFDENGLLETIRFLNSVNLAPIGAGATSAHAWDAYRRSFTVGQCEFKMAVISAFEFNTFHYDLGFYATSTRPGVGSINMDRLAAQIAVLKQDGFFVIVSPHWGENYAMRTQPQVRMAERMVEAGADLILGHGSHMLNEFGQIDGVWVAYGLGNLMFNSEGEYERYAIPPFSLVAELEITPRAAGLSGQLNLYPIVSCNLMTQFQPVFADENQFDHISELLLALQYDSQLFRTAVVRRVVGGRRCFSMKLF